MELENHNNFFQLCSLLVLLRQTSGLAQERSSTDTAQPTDVLVSLLVHHQCMILFLSVSFCLFCFSNITDDKKVICSMHGRILAHYISMPGDKINFQLPVRELYAYIMCSIFLLQVIRKEKERSYPCIPLKSVMHHHSSPWLYFWHLLYLFLGNL